MRREGLKAVWNFSKNSSDLVAPPFLKSCYTPNSQPGNLLMVCVYSVVVDNQCHSIYHIDIIGRAQKPWDAHNSDQPILPGNNRNSVQLGHFLGRLLFCWFCKVTASENGFSGTGCCRPFSGRGRFTKTIGRTVSAFRPSSSLWEMSIGKLRSKRYFEFGTKEISHLVTFLAPGLSDSGQSCFVVLLRWQFFLLDLAELVFIASEALEWWARQSNTGQLQAIYAFTGQY